MQPSPLSVKVLTRAEQLSHLLGLAPPKCNPTSFPPRTMELSPDWPFTPEISLMDQPHLKVITKGLR